MSTPAIIWLVLTGITFGVKSMNHGKSKKENVVSYLFDVIIVSGLLYWGGFFS